MIGVFPESYPDELFFSRCVRYHERIGYRNLSATARDLFGKRAVSVSVDLPGGLEIFVQNLPMGHSVTVDQLIDSNTLLPFYAPFLTLERVQRARLDMTYGSSALAHLRLGILTMKKRPMNLWYCPGCVEDDRNRFSETYWHRIHQLPGIQICPIHETHIVETDMHLSALRGRRDFVTAEKTIGDSPKLPPPNTDSHFAVKLRLARDAAWLLENANLSYSSSTKHRDRYLQLCFQRGVCTYSGKFDASFFCAVNDHYSDDLLRNFGCSLGHSETWAQRLVRNHRASQHPIYHLLMIHYLGLTASEFFNLPEKCLPFGPGPWPCLNKVCKYFRQDVIEKFDPTFTYRSRLPRGLFRCSCGFAYSRIGPEKTREDRYHVQNYITFGEEWDTYVRKHFTPDRPALRNLASRLELHPRTLRAELIRIGIVKSSCKPRRTGKTSKWNTVDPEKRERYREIFLETRKTLERRSEISRAISTVDGWLRLRDSAWWGNHAPPRLKCANKGPSVDWDKRDREMALAIPAEAKRIQDLPGHPVRFSRTLIGRGLRLLSLISRYGERLPLTTAVLQQCAETHVDYAVRRIWWAVSEYEKAGIIPSKPGLRAKAGVTDAICKEEKVRAALTAALEHFQPKLLWCVTEAA